MNVTYIITDQALTVFHEGNVFTVHGDDPRYTTALDALRKDDMDALITAIKPIEGIRRYISDNQRIVIAAETVYFDGAPIHNYCAGRLIDAASEALPLEPLVNFMTNLAENPSKKAADELLQFLEYGDLPLTEDGYFLAYKKVCDDYLDSYSRSVDNSVGQVVQMRRNQVQDDSTVTCSYGLHFCSLEYLRNFWGNRIMVLKINPRDVVSIPTDYNNTKGRCCKYEVIAELEETPEVKNVWGTPYVDTSEKVDPNVTYKPEDSGLWAGYQGPAYDGGPTQAEDEADLDDLDHYFDDAEEDHPVTVEQIDALIERFFAQKNDG